MRISSGIRVLRVLSIPLLFCGVAIGLVTVQAAIQRKAERTAAAAPPLAIAPALSGQTISVADLSVAASKGDLEARIEMGRRLAQGQGVRKSESSAVSYFKGIISEFEDIGAHDKRGPQVAAAFLEMARFIRTARRKPKSTPIRRRLSASFITPPAISETRPLSSNLQSCS